MGATAALAAAGIELIPWPSYFQDANPIENLWPQITRELDRTAPPGHEGRPAFRTRLFATARAHPAAALGRLTRSLPRRMDAICLAGGGMTKY